MGVQIYTTLDSYWFSHTEYTTHTVSVDVALLRWLAVTNHHRNRRIASKRGIWTSISCNERKKEWAVKFMKDELQSGAGHGRVLHQFDLAIVFSDGRAGGPRDGIERRWYIWKIW